MKRDATAALRIAADPAGRGKRACGKEPAKLTDEQREYIVRRLAAYERPSRIWRELRERVGIDQPHGNRPLRSDAPSEVRQALGRRVLRRAQGACREPVR